MKNKKIMINNNGTDEDEYEAKIIITKKVDGNASTDKKFKFKITIGTTVYYAEITKDSSWTQTVKFVQKTSLEYELQSSAAYVEAQENEK